MAAPKAAAVRCPPPRGGARRAARRFLVRPKAAQRGFSMIEIAVTLTVFVLLVGAAVPSMGDWLRNTRVRNAAESMQAGLQKARTEAIRSNDTVTFWLVSGADERSVDASCALSSVAGSWVVGRDDPTGQCDTAPSPTVVPMIVEVHAAGDGGSGVTVAAANVGAAAATCVRFNGFGRVADADALPADGCRAPDQISTIDLTHTSGARRLRIVVSGAGSVRLCDRDAAVADPRACP